jgi:hypothetical protein
VPSEPRGRAGEAEESGLSRGTFSMCFTPPGISTSWRANPPRHQGGTASSNPACSSGESPANLSRYDERSAPVCLSAVRGPFWVCAVERRHLSSGWKAHPAISLPPEATRAIMEVTQLDGLFKLPKVAVHAQPRLIFDRQRIGLGRPET